MFRSRVAAVVAAALLAAAVLAVPGTAQARQSTVTDVAGDTAEPGLDFTSVTMRNGDRAVAFTLQFARDRRGDVIVNVKPRHRPPALIVSRHRRQGPDKLFFSSRGEHQCRRLSSRWNRRDATLTLRLPARCLHGGNYGALRFWALTENDARDVDYAPETPKGNLTLSDSTPRG